MPSSFQELPHDIIHEIAVRSLPELPELTTVRPPLSLCHVSSSWRHVVQSSPELWSILFVKAPAKGNHPRLLNKILEWFGRAKTRPLSFFLSLEPLTPFSYRKYDGPSQYECFLKQLSPIVSRTRHLGLNLEKMEDFMEYFISKSLQWDFSKLDSFDLACEWGSFFSPTRGVAMVDLFKDALGLHCLSIHGMLFYDHIHVLDRQTIFPLSNLTTIVLQEPLVHEDWDSMIQSCPRMRYGDFTFNMYPVGPSGPINHGRLADLEVLLLKARLDGEHSLVAQVANLELPNLHTLRLDADYRAKLMSPEALGFQHFHCIQSLALNCGWRDGVDGMVQLFQQVVNVKELTLTFSDYHASSYKISRSLFKDMSYAESHIILPKLTSLRIHSSWSWGYSYDGFDVNALPYVIKSRSLSEPPVGCERLQSLTIALDLYRPINREEAKTKKTFQVLMLLCSVAGVAFDLTDSIDDWDKERSNRRAFGGMFDE